MSTSFSCGECKRLLYTSERDFGLHEAPAAEDLVPADGMKAAVLGEKVVCPGCGGTTVVADSPALPRPMLVGAKTLPR